MSRADRWKVSPMCGDGSARLPSMVRSRPWLRRMRASRFTSARFGTFLRVSRSPVSRLAIIRGSAAFLAPEMGMLPLSGLPPVTVMRSMCEDSLVTACRPDCVRRGRTACNWRNQPAGRIAGLVLPALLFHRLCGSNAAASLLLALLQVGAQLGGQPRATDFRLRARLLHGFGPLRHGHGCPDKTLKPRAPSRYYVRRRQRTRLRAPTLK